MLNFLRDKARSLSDRGRSAARRPVDRARARLREALQPPDDAPALPPDPQRRHVADRPHALSRQAWVEILAVLWDKLWRNRIFLIAAGVAFYTMLAIFPALSTAIWVIGFFIDPNDIVDRLVYLTFLLPDGAIELIQAQAKALAGHGRSGFSFYVVVGALFAVWSANSGMKAIIDAMNHIYGEDEKRSFLQVNARSMLFTGGALTIFLITMGVLVLAPVVISAGAVVNVMVSAAYYYRWPLLFAATVVFLTMLNRYGPDRPPQRARWAVWGSAIGAGMWILVSLMFSLYVRYIGNFTATYGSLAAIVGLMMWLWLSALVILLGVELNAELERRTDRWEAEWRALQARREAAPNARIRDLLRDRVRRMFSANR